MHSKHRNQLIGFITIILVGLILAPYFLTNKSRQINHTISLLPSSQQQEDIIQGGTNDFSYMESTEQENRYNQSDFPENTPEPSTAAHQDTATPPQTIEELVSESEIAENSQVVVDKSYMIQLVALKNRQKIEELAALLILNNYEVHTDPKNAQPDQIIRLLVGPYPTKEQVEMIMIDLEHLTKLKGIIVTK